MENGEYLPLPQKSKINVISWLILYEITFWGVILRINQSYLYKQVG